MPVRGPLAHMVEEALGLDPPRDNAGHDVRMQWDYVRTHWQAGSEAAAHYAGYVIDHPGGLPRCQLNTAKLYLPSPKIGALIKSGKAPAAGTDEPVNDASSGSAPCPFGGQVLPPPVGTAVVSERLTFGDGLFGGPSRDEQLWFPRSPESEYSTDSQMLAASVSFKPHRAYASSWDDRVFPQGITRIPIQPRQMQDALRALTCEMASSTRPRETAGPGSAPATHHAHIDSTQPLCLQA